MMMGTMLGMSAIVVDLGYARTLSRQSQGATDAAALAGASALPCSANATSSATCDGSPSTSYSANLDAARNRAVAYLAADLTDDGTLASTACAAGVNPCQKTLGDTQVWVTTPYPATSATGYQLIHAKACRVSPTFFARAIGRTAPTVCREAVARKKSSTKAFLRGLVATDPSACSAMYFGGNSETVLTSNGAVVVESNCPGEPGALDTNGSSWNLQAGAISVVGNATLAPCSIEKCTNNVEPEEGAEPAGDPFSGIAEPTAPSTVYATEALACPIVSAKKMCKPGRWTFEFKPNGGDYLFQPGIYYLDPGAGKDAFNSGGNTSLQSDPAFAAALGGPLFFVKSGSFTMNGSGAVALRAHATAPWSGMSVFSARSNAAEMKINGTANFQVGTVYAPASKLTLLGNGEMNITGQVISRTAEISGSVNININVVESPDINPAKLDLGLEK